MNQHISLNVHSLNCTSYLNPNTVLIPSTQLRPSMLFYDVHPKRISMESNEVHVKPLLPTVSVSAALEVVPASLVIPVLEKGLEIEKLELCTNPKNQESKKRIRASRILLCLLYAQAAAVSVIPVAQFSR
jgi:hypothetical protein